LGSAKAKVTVGAGRWVKKAALAAKAHLEGRERPQALAKAKAALAAVGKANAMGKTLDRNDTFAEKACPQKNRLSATGTRSTEWRASAWVA
jgi:hypothetical protein